MHTPPSSPPAACTHTRPVLTRCPECINDAQAAGEAEFASWRETMLNEAEDYCPPTPRGSRFAHDYVRARFVFQGRIYCGRCMDCGHHSQIPF